MKKQVNLLSGSPELRRFLVQKCLNYAAMLPLEMQEFAWCCSILGVQLIADANDIWLEPISFKET